jgi:hypothetical protein
MGATSGTPCSTGASVLNTTNPLTPTFGSPPGGYYNSPPGTGGFYNPPPLYGSMSPPDYGAGISAATTETIRGSMITALTCILVATLSLNLYKQV